MFNNGTVSPSVSSPLGANALNMRDGTQTLMPSDGSVATDTTIFEIREATKRVLTETFPSCLTSMGLDDDVSVLTENEKLIEVCGVRYLLTFAGTPVSFWIGLNVRRLILVIFLDRDRLMDPVVAEAAGDALIPAAFRHCLRGAKHVGYDVHPEQATVDGHEILSLWMTLWLPNNFLQSPADQVFVGQDIALMLQSLCRAASREGLKLSAKVAPRPL